MESKIYIKRIEIEGRNRRTGKDPGFQLVFIKKSSQKKKRKKKRKPKQ